MTEIFKAFILGIIEGVTEFLPVSSTGHLLVAQKLIGFKDDVALFTVVIQFGAIAAAAWYFRNDLVHIWKQCRAKDAATIRFVRNVFVGLLPAGIIGLIVEKTFGIPDSLVAIGVTLIIGGIIFLIIEQKYAIEPAPDGSINYDSITLGRSLAIGFAQCLALIPGVSRSGATIMAGMASGLDRKTAAVFSFYLSIPIMFAASALKLIDGRSELQNISGGAAALVVGLVVSAITAFIVVKWLMKYVQTNTFKPFAYYRISVGILLLIGLFFSR
jgi:undecaprenyl-diphosphatase